MHKNNIYLIMILCCIEVNCFASATQICSFLSKTSRILYKDLCEGVTFEPDEKTPNEKALDALNDAQYRALPLTQDERALDDAMRVLINIPRTTSNAVENLISCPGKTCNRCSKKPLSDRSFQQLQAGRCGFCFITTCTLCTGGLAASACGCPTAAAALFLGSKTAFGIGLLTINTPGGIPEQMRMTLAPPTTQPRMQ